MTVRKPIALVVSVIVCLSLGTAAAPQSVPSLCEKGEKIIFSCTIKERAKIVSLCASPDVSKDRGYIQYRFGLPGKIELEFPQTREHTQQAFKYSHYFRAQVDETEISFTSEKTEYAIFDNYNGEQNPVRQAQGIDITLPKNPKPISLWCSGRAKADYGNLGDVLPTGETP